jgi:hypothetical protein
MRSLPRRQASSIQAQDGRFVIKINCIPSGRPVRLASCRTGGFFDLSQCGEWRRDHAFDNSPPAQLALGVGWARRPVVAGWVERGARDPTFRPYQ